MDAAAWRAHWAEAEARYLAERDERYARIGGRDESVSRSAVAVAPVVLEPAGEVESDSCPVAATRRAYAAALGAGWSARITRAVAAVPKVGVLTTWALRARRHDERLWACWWGGSFDAAQYYRRGSGGVEILGGERMSMTWAPGAVLAVEVMTVAQIKALATERGIKIPSKYAKAAAIEHVKAHGLIGAPVPPPRRGVLDALEGLHLTRH